MRTALVILMLGVVVCVALFFGPDSALAGRSSTGESAFYPCDRCHPVFLDADGKPTRPLPNKLEKHEIGLEVHDALGAGDKACLACHDDPTRDPGKLRLPDDTLVDIKGDVSRVCQRCHFEKYRDWQLGIHGKNAPKCSAAGCHDPHTPSWMYVSALPPFQGTGMEVRAVSEREPFTPLASPPVHAAVETPGWLMILTALGALVFFGCLAFVISRGRTR